MCRATANLHKSFPVQILKRQPFFQVAIYSYQSGWLSALGAWTRFQPPTWPFSWGPLYSHKLNHRTWWACLCAPKVCAPRQKRPVWPWGLPRFLRGDSSLNLGGHWISCFLSCKDFNPRERNGLRSKVEHPVPFRQSPLPPFPPTSSPPLVSETLSCPFPGAQLSDRKSN